MCEQLCCLLGQGQWQGGAGAVRGRAKGPHMPNPSRHSRHTPAHTPHLKEENIRTVFPVERSYDLMRGQAVSMARVFLVLFIIQQHRP